MMPKTVEVEVVTRETIALKYCPFCTNEESVHVVSGDEHDYYVECCACNASGPTSEDVKGAVTGWNTRRRKTSIRGQED